jgi:hypothetical protein
MKSRHRLRCGSVNKTHSSIMTDSGNYLNFAGSVWMVIMLGSTCVKLYSEVQEKYLIRFSRISIPVTENKMGGFTF